MIPWLEPHTSTKSTLGWGAWSGASAGSASTFEGQDSARAGKRRLPFERSELSRSPERADPKATDRPKPVAAERKAPQPKLPRRKEAEGAA